MRDDYEARAQAFDLDYKSRERDIEFLAVYVRTRTGTTFINFTSDRNRRFLLGHIAVCRRALGTMTTPRGFTNTKACLDAGLKLLAIMDELGVDTVGEVIR